MKPARVDTKQKLEALVQRMREQERRVRLVEVGETASAPTATPAAAGQAPTQASTTTAAPTPAQLDKPTPDVVDVTIESVIQQLNAIRAGKSLKDTLVQQELTRYFDGLEDSEKEALHAYMKGLAQIISGQVDAGQAEDPDNHGVETKIVNKKTRQIKPNVVKKSVKPTAVPVGNPVAGAPKEDTTAPSAAPIVPKKR